MVVSSASDPERSGRSQHGTQLALRDRLRRRTVAQLRVRAHEPRPDRWVGLDRLEQFNDLESSSDPLLLLESRTGLVGDPPIDRDRIGDQRQRHQLGAE